MNNNNSLKSILAVIFVLAVSAFLRFRGGDPSTTASNPSAPDSSSVSTPNDTSKDTREQDAPKRAAPADDDEKTSTKTVDTGGAPKRDLDQDERRHGHTLQRHIARTDEQLLERLKDEPDISSASTWLDKDTAERCVGAALEKNKSKIENWLRQGGNRQNLVFDYYGDGKTPIGRSMHRNATHSIPVYNAKIVLKADGESFHVLTSYPEDR